MNPLSRFHYFFDCCIGGWHTERTYHDLNRQDVERSSTDFTIRTLTPPLCERVLQKNCYSSARLSINNLLGFHLAFETLSERGEEVGQQLNMLFIPTTETNSLVQGDYLRDQGFEDNAPIVAHFQFDPVALELKMTTTYSAVVALDSIILLNPRLRLRQILTYARPDDNQPPTDLIMAGFGVEQKITGA